jgi:hypothetical protein
VKSEYREGPKAREEFERAMNALFKAAKNRVTKAKQKSKKKKADKG